METNPIVDVQAEQPAKTKRVRKPKVEGEPKAKRVRAHRKPKDAVECEIDPLQDKSMVASDKQKPVILPKETPPQKKMTIHITLDQKDIVYKDEKVDPHGNTLKSLSVEIVGNVDIAKVAGRIANSLFDFHTSLAAVKGIKRAAGFNVNLFIQDESITKDGSVKITSVSKVRMSNPVDIAFKVATSIMNELEVDNSEALLTGNFRVSDTGKLFLAKLGFDEAVTRLPRHLINQQLNGKRITINNNVRQNRKALLN